MENIRLNSKIIDRFKQIDTAINISDILNNTIDLRVYRSKEEYTSKMNLWNYIKKFKIKTIKEDNLNIKVYKIRNEIFISAQVNNSFVWLRFEEKKFLDLYNKKDFKIFLKKMLLSLSVLIIAVTPFIFPNVVSDFQNEMTYQITNFQEANNWVLQIFKDAKVQDVNSYFLINDSVSISLQQSIDYYKYLQNKFDMENLEFKNYLDSTKNIKSYYTVNDAENLKIFNILDASNFDSSTHDKYSKITSDLSLRSDKKYSFNELKPYFEELQYAEIGYYSSLEKNYHDIIDWLVIVPKDIVNLYVVNQNNILGQNKIFNDFDKNIGVNNFNNWITLNFTSWLKQNPWSRRFLMNNELFIDFRNKTEGKYPEILKQYDNQKYFDMYNNYLNWIDNKLKGYWFNIYKSDNNNAIFNIWFWWHLDWDQTTWIEYLNSLLYLKNKDLDLFNKYIKFASLNQKLLKSSVLLNSEKHWFNQEWVKLYMEVFWLSEKEYLKSIELGYNINIDKYLWEIFKWTDIYKKDLKTYSLIENWIYNSANIYIDDSTYKWKFTHELTHLLNEVKKSKNFADKEISISDYFKNFQSNWDDNSIFYWDYWNSIFKDIYIEELTNRNGFVNRNGFSEYSINQAEIGNMGDEYMTEFTRLFLQSPWYYAYLDLYWWDWAKHIRKTIPYIISFLEEFWIFTQKDYDYYKQQARIMKINIDINKDKKVGELR